MDEHPGSHNIPLTLNKYLYANADPINHIDPSGYFSLGSIGSAMSVMSSLSVISVSSLRGAAILAKNAKIYDIYDFVNPWPLHFYMYVESKVTRSGYRYDVGAEGGWRAIRRHNPFGILPGGHVRASYADRRTLDGRGMKVASHTLGQWLLWHMSVMGTEQNECKINYSINPSRGINCLSWTIRGTAMAIIISRIRI